MKGINKAIIVGTLGLDPETRYIQSGKAITNISVATSEKWKDKQTGEQQEKTEWHRIVFFGRLAEIAGEFLKKGSQVYIEGKLQTRKWQDDSGTDRWSTEIIAQDMQMLGSGGSRQQGQSQGFRDKPQVDPAEYRGNDYGNDELKSQPPADESARDEAFADDDIPF